MNLEPIKARLAAATEGPWRVVKWGQAPDETKRHEIHWGRLNPPFPNQPMVARIGNGWHVPADAELIAHAPTDLAELVAEVERLQAVINAVSLTVGFWDYAGKDSDESMRRIADLCAAALEIEEEK